MLVFRTPGIIPIEAFTKFGINVKPNTDSPIGYFGTGLKYAVAVTLRLGGRMRVFSGTTEWEFVLKDMDFRGTLFSGIRMRKRSSPLKRWVYEELPFTTELGKNWEPWMALREIESNTRDENGETLVCDEFQTHISHDSSVIVIECPEMEEPHRIFMPENIPLLATTPLVDFYMAESSCIFYRGLRVMDLEHPSPITYNLTHTTELTEDRTLKFPESAKNIIASMIQQSSSAELIEIILARPEKSFEATLSLDTSFYGRRDTWNRVIGERVAGGYSVLPRAHALYREEKMPASKKMVELVLTATQEDWLGWIEVVPERLGELIKEAM